MSELRDQAERLLFGSRLEDKLAPLERLTDVRPGQGILPPKSPGRPPGLELRRGLRSEFPRSFSSGRARGTALHFFANHELLAIELMALCLLRFPEAPAAFRRGLANIISEEQEHLRMYISGAGRLGVELGEQPVNAFFWDALRNADSPLAFVAGMGLTFEQANLDHCRRFIGLFDQAGDSQSAELLRKVYADELRHVRHGLSWFRSWKEPGATDFEAHREALSKPLTIARAKSRPFDEAGRRSLGFGEDYIRSLRLFSHSAGRPPNVYVFNPGCEAELARPDTPAPKAARLRREWLGLLPMFIAGRDDVVLVRSRPPDAHMERLQALGFELPQLVSWPDEKEVLGERIIGELRPWGWSPGIARELSPLGGSWEGRSRGIHGKSWSSRLLRRWMEEVREPWLDRPEDAGRPCMSLEEVREELRRLAGLGHGQAMVKAEWGTAGRGNARVRGSLLPEQERWLEKLLAAQGLVVVEPLLDKAADYSVQLWIGPAGKARKEGHHLFFTDARGQYLGHQLGSFAHRLPKGVARFLHGDGHEPGRWRKLLDESVRRVGTALAREGYRGPAGIDGMIHWRDGSPVVRPVVEVNPRQTMGRIALGLEKRVRGKGLFFFLPGEEAARLAAELPARSRDNQLVSGLVPLTPSCHPVAACAAAGKETLAALLPLLPAPFQEPGHA